METAPGRCAPSPPRSTRGRIRASSSARPPASRGRRSSQRSATGQVLTSPRARASSPPLWPGWPPQGSGCARSSSSRPPSLSSASRSMRASRLSTASCDWSGRRRSPRHRWPRSRSGSRDSRGRPRPRARSGRRRRLRHGARRSRRLNAPNARRASRPSTAHPSQRPRPRTARRARRRRCPRRAPGYHHRLPPNRRPRRRAPIRSRVRLTPASRRWARGRATG